MLVYSRSMPVYAVFLEAGFCQDTLACFFGTYWLCVPSILPWLLTTIHGNYCL